MNTYRTTLPVKGMKCQKCVARVTALLTEFPEIDQVKVSLTAGEAELFATTELLLHAEIAARLSAAGFETTAAVEEEANPAMSAAAPAAATAPSGNATELRFPVGGMHCASCAATIERRVGAVAGVEEVAVNLAGNFAQVRYQPEQVTPEAIYSAVDQAGFKALRGSAPDLAEDAKKELRLVVIAAAGAVPIMLLMYFPLLGGATLYLNAVLASIVQFTAGLGFYGSAWKSLRNRSANMDVLVALGISAAYGYSLLALFGLLGAEATVFFETSAMLILFIRFGKLLESRAKGRASAALKKILQLQADSALLIKDGKEQQVPIATVVPGDLVLVKPGEKIPVDGEVVEGRAAVDESMISGEAVPVAKEPGSAVIGATVNRSGRLLIRATHVGEAAVLAQIVRMVETAQGDKPPIQRLADRISNVFVPIVIALSLLTFCGWLVVGKEFLFAFQMAVAVVVVACPCALGLATPTAIMVGSSVGLELGILFKKATVLEQISGLQTLLFDKTGTLTKGRFSVEQVISCGDMKERELLAFAASLESASTHPLAQSIVEKAAALEIPVPAACDIVEIGGHGLSGTTAGRTVLCGSQKLLSDHGVDLSLLPNPDHFSGNSLIFIAIDDKLQGIVCLADEIKDNAGKVVSGLRQLGIEPVLVTGDRQEAADRVAAQLGISLVEAEVLPEQKLAIVKKYQQLGQRVGMVGDGINDAPALAQADIGIAIGSGTDVAKETGDLVLVGGDLFDIERGILLGKKTLWKIKQNLFWAFFYNLLGIPLAAGLFFPWFGLYLKPEYAGLAMAFSSVSVVTNSLLLRRSKKNLAQLGR